MLPDREGRFKATIGDHGVAETGPNNLATFICTFHLTQELADGAWLPVDEDLSIAGYFYLEKRDGSLNTVTIEQLKEAFGWDGRDPFWLQDTDFAALGHVVQVKLAFEAYDGKTRIKVQYVNPEDWAGGGVPVADDTMRRSIANRLGAKFRANAGGRATPAPRPGNTQSPATTTSAAGTATQDVPATATMEQAWQAFTEACPEKWTRQNIEDEWFRVLGELVPDKQPDEFSGAEWARVLAEGPDAVIPL